MKNKTALLSMGLCLVAPASFADSPEISMEQRLQRLEQRLYSAESRAQTAEEEIKQLKSSQTLSHAQPVPVVGTASAHETRNNKTEPTLTLSGFGDLNFYGDVEFNMDAESRKGSLISQRDDSNEK